MAKRLSRALAGLGVGLGNAGEMMMRSHLQEQMQDRYDKRAAAAQMAQLDRQGQMADRTQMMKIMEEVMKGGDPDAAAQMISMLIGKDIAPEDLPRPGPRRRMQTAIGERIDKATSPGMVPSDEEIVGAADTVGASLPRFATDGIPETSWADKPDPYLRAGSPAREFGQIAGARRRTMLDTPSEKITGTNASGQSYTQMVSPSQAAQRILTSPTAQQTGELKGTEKKAELGISGDALAAQAAKEAGEREKATQGVRMSPDAITARVGEEGRTTYARKVAEINANVDNAQKIIDYETQKALAAMPLAATEVEFKQWGEQIAKAKEAASQAMPVLGQLRALWVEAQPEMERLLNENPTWLLQLKQGYLPRGFIGNEATRKYLDFLEAARPRLARAMGNVGNFTEGEQQRGGYVVADALDAANGGASANEKFNRMEKLFMAAPSIAQRQRPGSKPITVEEINELLDRWTPALQGDKELPATQGFDLLITPDGIQTRKPGQ